MDGWYSAEDAELNLLIGGGLPMGQVVEVDEKCTGHGAEKLRDNIAGHLGPFKFAVGSQANRYGRVEVSARVGVRGVDAEGDGKAPAEGDGKEIIAVAFGASQFDVGDDAAADGAHNEGAEELGEVGADGVHGGLPGKGLREVWELLVELLPVFSIYENPDMGEAQYFCVISPLYISHFSGFWVKNKCRR